MWVSVSLTTLVGLARSLVKGTERGQQPELMTGFGPKQLSHRRLFRKEDLEGSVHASLRLDHYGVLCHLRLHPMAFTCLQHFELQLTEQMANNEVCVS
jgi:hypothetical protein